MPLFLWIIAGIIAFFVIASFMPFSIYVKGWRFDEEHGFQTSFYWPWKAFGIGIRQDSGGLYMRILFAGRCLYERKRRRKERKPKKKKKKEKKSKKGGSFNIFLDRRLLERLIRTGLKFLRDILSSFRRPRLSGDVEIGLSDPAATGILSGVIYSVSRRGMWLGDLRISPNYVDSVLIGDVDFNTGARPAGIMAALIKLPFRLPIVELVKFARRRKRAAKEVN